MFWIIRNKSFQIVDENSLQALEEISLNKNEETALKLIETWHSGQNLIFNTSGTSGRINTIELSSELIEWSAKRTAEWIGEKHKALVCLPIDKIGGAMLVLRGILGNWTIQIDEASSYPLKQITNNHDFSLISLVPYQLYHILEDLEELAKLLQFRIVLLGGEALRREKELELLRHIDGRDIKIFHTYGMTETASHIALRELGQESYWPFRDVEIGTSMDEEIVIRIPHLNWEIQTTDRVEILEDGSFKIVGRSQFIVNSGGLKIILEEQEHEIGQLLGPKFSKHFFLWKEEDKEFGERLIFISDIDSSEVASIIEGKLKPYTDPKRYYQIPEILRTSSGKTDRMKSFLQINRSQT